MPQIVIPAAGNGKRLKEINPYGLPKSLIEIGGVKIIDIQLKSLANIKNKEFIFITGAANQKLEEYILNKKLDNVKFIYNKDFESTNCGYSLSLALPYIKNDWIYLNSDLILEKSAFKLISKFIGLNSVCVNLGNRTDLHTFISNDKNIITKWMPIDTNLTSQDEINKMPTPDGEIVGPILCSQSLSNELLFKFNSFDKKQKKLISCYTLFSKLIKRNFLTIDITDYLWKEIDTVEDYNEAAKLISKFK